MTHRSRPDSAGPLAILLLGWLTATSLSAQPPPSLRLLDDFESTNSLPEWKRSIYVEAQPPAIRLDERNAHQGQSSLLIASDAPADVALGRVVSLPPRSLWRARCWVKTEDLRARDRTDTGGAVHIQTPSGAGLARGSSSFGSTPWHEVLVPFRAPDDGQIKVVLFYIGFGKGTGKAWFDDLRLEEIRSDAPLEVRVTAERLTRGPVDAKQGGQFIEPLCELIPSMISQQVANSSFEEEPPFKVEFRRDVDKPHRPWYPDGAVHRAVYAYDARAPFNGRRSLRIELSAPGARAGVSQDGFQLRQGRSYALRLHARASGRASLRASLHGEGGAAGAPIEMGEPRSEWTLCAGVLRASRSLENATLTLDFEGPGTVWLDRVSLIGDDAILGWWRPDVVRALRGLRSAVIRFGGSTMEAYEWDQCVGAPDSRAPYSLEAWGGLDENFIGPEEFVGLCREVGAEPLICQRWTGKSPADAAAEVEYFNGAPDTAWGRRRAQNGRTRPWGVKYWQIGNEVGGTAYDASVNAFAEAMRRVDPSIKILSAFPSANLARIAGQRIDYLCPHHYDCAQLSATERDIFALEGWIQDAGAGHPLRIAVTEWNTTAGDWGLGRATLQTLGNALACSRYHHLMHRHADSVEIAIRSNLIDSFGSGVIQTGPGWLYLAPTYYAQQLYARAAGAYPARIQVLPKETAQPIPRELEEPDLSALISADGRKLYLYTVNSTGRTLTTRTRLPFDGSSAVGGVRYALTDSRHGLTPEVFNTRDDPTRVRLSQRPLRGCRAVCDLVFDPFSVTLHEFDLPHR